MRLKICGFKRGFAIMKDKFIGSLRLTSFFRIKVICCFILFFSLAQVYSYAADGTDEGYIRKECTINLITEGDIPNDLAGAELFWVENYDEEGNYSEYIIRTSDLNSSITIGYMYDVESGHGRMPNISQTETSSCMYDIYLNTEDLWMNFGNPDTCKDTYNVYISFSEIMTPWLFVDENGKPTADIDSVYSDDYGNIPEFEPGTLVLGDNTYIGDVKYDYEKDECGEPSEKYDREYFTDSFGDTYTLLYNAPWDQYRDRIKTIIFWGGIYRSSIDNLQLEKYKQVEKYDVIRGRCQSEQQSETCSAEDGVLYDFDKITLLRYPCKKKDESFILNTGSSENAFNGCCFLKRITVTSNASYFSIANCPSLTDVVLQEGVERLYSLYKCTNLTNVTLPESLTHIYSRAFYGCKNLTKLFIPKNVNDIDPYAFSHCTKLRDLRIDENNQSYCIENGSILSKDKTKLILYLPSNSAAEYTIPNKVTTIGREAFYRSNNLNKIRLSDNIKTIDPYAFNSCANLSEIIVPKSLETVGSGAFSNCAKLNKVFYEGSVRDWLNITIGYSNSDFTNAVRTYDFITTYSSYIRKNGLILLTAAIPDAVPDTADILVASYSGSRLLEIGSLFEKSSDNSATYLLNEKGVTDIKVFVWDRSANMIPITYCEKITLSE